jgi:hypothetical protein
MHINAGLGSYAAIICFLPGNKRRDQEESAIEKSTPSEVLNHISRT